MKTRIIVAALFLPLLIGVASCTAQEKGDVTSPGKKARGEGWLGVRTEDMTHRLAKSMKLKTSDGALVREVMEDTPAEKAGIQEDDVIIEFNGEKIQDADDLVHAVRKSSPGSSVAVGVMRNDEPRTIQVTLGRTPMSRTRALLESLPRMDARTFAFRPSSLGGMSLQDLNEQLGLYFEAPNGRGVLVQEVEEDSRAAKAGFKAGDVIIRVGKETVEEISDIWDALHEAKDGESETFEVIRKGTHETISMKVDALRDDHRFLRFRSEGHPGRFELRDFDMDAPPGELRMERDDLRHYFEDLGRELRSAGKEIREKMEELRDDLRSKIRSVVG